MKRLKYGLLAAALVASAAAVPAVSNAEAVGGWVKSAGGWWYQYADGSYAASEFVGGYWLNGAGWLKDNTSYNWIYNGLTGDWSYVGRYQGKMWKATSNWYKIDGEWYFFLGDGTLATNQFVGPDGDYYVDENGAWVDGVTGGWMEQADGSWKFGMTKDGETTYYAADPATFNDGWYEINGVEYHFDEDGILDTWKVIETPVYVDGKQVDTDIYGVGKNGNKGTITGFVFNDDAEFLATFTFANSKEKKEAAKELKTLFQNVYGSMGDNKTYENTFFINDKAYEVDVYRKAPSGETEYDEDGNVKPKKATIEVEIGGVDIVEFIKNTEGGKFAVKIYGDVTEVLDYSRVITKSSTYDYKIILGTDKDKDPVVTEVSFNGNYLNLVIDGTEYQALTKYTYWDKDGKKTEDITKAVEASDPVLYFLGDLTHKLGDKLAAKGIINASFTVDTLNQLPGDLVTYEEVVEEDEDGDPIINY